MTHQRHSRHSHRSSRGDKKHRGQRNHSASHLAVILPLALALATCGVVVFLAFKPPSAPTKEKARSQENQSTFSDRATAFKVLELMDANRISEAVTLAETIADKLPRSERALVDQITKTPGETRAMIESYICNWITVEYATATQTSVSRRVGFPSPSTPDIVVNFLCDYADYRARSFRPAPRDISEELLGRIFLLSAAEKGRRLGVSKITAE